MNKGAQHSAEQKAIESRKSRIVLMHQLRDYSLILIGVVSAGFGLKGFLLPNSFIDGGATGISLLIEVVSGVPLSILLIVINLPFIALATKTIGTKFAVKSILAILVLSVVVHVVPYPIITEDKLLIAVFGGFFLGMGIGMAIRGGAVIDGTEVLAIFLSRRTGFTIGDIILVFNIVIFSFGAYLLSVEIALYAILTYMSAAKTVDFIVDGIEEYVGVTIISEKSEEMRLMITEDLRNGCTVYSGKKGYTQTVSNLKRSTSSSRQSHG